MRLIDADALLQNYDLYKCEKDTDDREAYYHARDTLMLYEIKWMIDDAPTISIPEAAKYRIPKPLKIIHWTCAEGIDSDMVCPSCEGRFSLDEWCDNVPYCPRCGQALDWTAEGIEDGNGKD